MIRNIVFDLGGVIIDYNPEKTLAKYFDSETAENLLRVLFRNPVWAQLDRGTITVSEAMETVRGKIPTEIFEKVYALVENWGNEMPPFERMPAVIKDLKDRGFGVYLLSNAPLGFHSYKKDIPALALFDGLFISADYKLLKPEREIYLAFLNTFSLRAEECFFIDDMPVNVDGARAAGFDGYCHDGNIDKLKTVLSNINKQR